MFEDSRCHILNFDTPDLILIVNTILDKLKKQYNINDYISINKKHLEDVENLYIDLKSKVDKKFEEYRNKIIDSYGKKITDKLLKEYSFSKNIHILLKF